MHRLTFELLIRIFVELTAEDICNIELVSRQWYRCCTEDVWKAYFEIRWGTIRFTPLKLRIRRCESGGLDKPYETLPHEPFTWRKQVLARYYAIESWKRVRIPTISYRIARYHVFNSAVNWQQGILLQVSDSTPPHGRVHRLYDGSFFKGFEEMSVHTRSNCTTPFGIADSKYFGCLTYTNTRQEVYQVHPSCFDCVWLSPTSAATSPSGITIVASRDHKVLFFSNLHLVGQTNIVNPDERDYMAAKEICQLNEDEFLILTHHAVYRVSIGKFKVLFNIRADHLHVAYPFVFTSGDQGLQRFHLETKEKTLFAYLPVFRCTHDNNIIVAYTLQDQLLRAWATSSDEPIWSIPTPLSIDCYHSVTAMALNAAVLVCGGYKGTSCVIDVLTGELVAFKKAKKIEKPLERDFGDSITQRPPLSIDSLEGIQCIHLGPAYEPRMVLILENTVTLYGATRSRLQDNCKLRVKSVPESKVQPKLTRKGACDLDYDPEEVYEDARAVSMAPDTLEKEQLEVALALSLS